MKNLLLILALTLFAIQAWSQVPVEALEYHYTKDSVLNPKIMGPSSVCLGVIQQYEAQNVFAKEKTEWKVLGNTAKVRTIYTDHRLEVEFVKPGTVKLVLERQSDWGKGMDTLEIEIRPSPTVSFGGDTTLCPGDSLILQVNTAFPEFKWSDGFEKNKRVVTQSGLYRVRVKDNGGCMTEGNIAVDVATKPNVDLGGDQVTCEGRAPVLKAGNGYDSYLWQNGSTSSTFQVSQAGLHWVQVMNGCGMLGGDSVQIRPAAVQPVTLGQDRFVCDLDRLRLDAGAGFQRYEWQDGSYSRYLPVKESKIYWVDAIDKKGCKVRGTVRIELESCESDLKIPKAFSPNGDGLNDIFKPQNLEGVRSFGIQIMDQEGLIVYFAAHLAAAWDGKFNGNPAKAGTYSYSIQYRTGRIGKRKYEAGSLRLRR